jgi:acid phosphatase type 7
MCVAAGYHPSWGNYGSDSGEECGIPTFYRFQTPKNGNNVFWYRYGARTERGVGV